MVCREFHRVQVVLLQAGGVLSVQTVLIPTIGLTVWIGLNVAAFHDISRIDGEQVGSSTANARRDQPGDFLSIGRDMCPYIASRRGEARLARCSLVKPPEPDIAYRDLARLAFDLEANESRLVID